jgi:septum formation protein
MEVVIHDGVIREKPSTPEEARKFIKGLCYFVEDLELFNNVLYLTCPCPVLLDEHILLSGYSESHAATIGSVLVTNVKTGARREGWDKAEVLSKFLWYFYFLE